MRRRLIGCVALVLAIAACSDSGSGTTTTSAPPSTDAATTAAPTTTSTTTSSPTTTSTPTTTVDPSLARPLDGWQSVASNASIFDGFSIGGAVVSGGRLIVVGCPVGGVDPGVFPVWYSDDGVEWTGAVGDARRPGGTLDCLTDVVETPFGLFAYGYGLLHSQDGLVWDPVGFTDSEGWALGYVDAVFAVGDRVTVLLQRGAESESTVATLLTTTDGVNWEQGPDADLFGSSGVAAAIAGGDGLIAVGASPWGEFVPTAAAWTSADGLSWRRVTPRLGAGFDEAYMFDVIARRGGFVAVGGDPQVTSLMAAWTSPDGVSWRRAPLPQGDSAAQFGFMDAIDLTAAAGKLWAIGRDHDAGRAPNELPAVWESPDGISWTRVTVDPPGIAIPFHIVELGGEQIGFWPPNGWVGSEPVQVLRSAS